MAEGQPADRPKEERLTIVQRESAFREALQSALSSMLSIARGFDAAKTDEFAEASKQTKLKLVAAFDAFFAEETRTMEKVLHRQHIVDELCSTEDDYLNDLLTLDNVWQAELQKSGLLSPQDLHTLFGPLKQLEMLCHEMNFRIGEEKAKPCGEQHVGQVFASLIPYFKVYIEYCSAQISSAEIAQNLSRNSKYKEFAEKLKASNPYLKNLDLGAYLIKPTQRITKYPLFLKDLVRSTAPEHPDYQYLVSAQEEMHKVLTEINLRTRRSETAQLLLRIAPCLTWKSDPAVDLLRSGSLLVKEGRVALYLPHIDKEANYVMIFDNVIIALVLAKERFKEVSLFDTARLSITELFMEPKKKEKTDSDLSDGILRQEMSLDTLLPSQRVEKQKKRNSLSLFRRSKGSPEFLGRSRTPATSTLQRRAAFADMREGRPRASTLDMTRPCISPDDLAGAVLAKTGSSPPAERRPQTGPNAATSDKEDDKGDSTSEQEEEQTSPSRPSAPARQDIKLSPLESPKQSDSEASPGVKSEPTSVPEAMSPFQLFKTLSTSTSKIRAKQRNSLPPPGTESGALNHD
eukprot:m51a1_g14030 putative domain containing protein (575) ;mRNA; r:1124581-1127283